MPHLFPRSILALILALSVIGCAKPAEEKKPEEQKHIQKDLKPEVYPLPEGVKQALPGLQNDNIYIYREVMPTVNLVVYSPDYSRENAVKMMAEAFVAMTGEPKLREGIDFWIIQVQPSPDGKPTGEEPARLVVWGVKPAEVDAYMESRDLAKFLRDSEYLLVDDKIIAAGDARLAEFPGLPAPAPDTAPAPLPGSTADAEAPAPAEPAQAE